MKIKLIIGLLAASSILATAPLVSAGSRHKEQSTPPSQPAPTPTPAPSPVVAPTPTPQVATPSPAPDTSAEEQAPVEDLQLK